MWPDSPFAHPVGSFRYPVPLVPVDPDVNPDVTVCFRREWLPYIIGSLQQLLLQSTWDTRDPDALNRAQGQAQLLVSMFIQGCPPDVPPAPIIIDEMEYQMAICEQLRWENGVLQGLCCGEWVNIGGIGGAIPGAVTQPPPTTTPPTNECRDFYVTLNARDKWLLPFPVSAGATIQVVDAAGGWNDGTPTWACPTGAVYGLGICGAPLALTAGDPIPTLPHMQIVAQYGTSGGWFDPMALPYIIPVGVTDAQVTFQANDSVLTDNQGSVTFKVRVCNNPVSTWCHKWLGGKGIAGLSLPPQSGIYGAYEYVTDRIVSEDTGAGPCYRAVWASVDIPFSGTITAIEFVTEDSSGCGAPIAGAASDAHPANDCNIFYDTIPAGAATHTHSWTGSEVIASRLRIFASNYAGGATDCHIVSIMVSGLGPNPFGSDNC